MAWTLTCETCHERYHFEHRDGDSIPINVFLVKCNWCPKCEDRAEDHYYEWWDDDDQDPNRVHPDDVPDNQLTLPFIFDELQIKKHEPITTD